MTDVQGGPSKVVIDRGGEANSAEHDSGAEADGTDFKIGQSKHEVPSAGKPGELRRSRCTMVLRPLCGSLAGER
jgi:hypothetical protein